mgnify:CR=1 FL=1
MPRTPTYGRAAGPGDAVGSSIYELYAPQRASTEFGVDFARTGYEFQKEVELEKQRQLDAKIAQHELGEELQKEGAAKTRSKRRKGEKVSSATAWGTAGAKLGSAAGLPGSIVGGIVGGLGGWLFGEEGGMVPAIHPNSLLYKQYQAGGDVTGYSGGQPKFLRRGYQNLQFRQEDLARLEENVGKMGKYGFWDAAKDIGKGYIAGKSLAPEIKKYSDLLGSTLGVAKEKGWGTALEILTGKATGIPEWSDDYAIRTDIPEPNFGQYENTRLSIGQKDMDKYIDWKDKKALTEKSDLYSKLFPSKPSVTKPSMAPARKATYTGSRNPFRKRTKPKPQISMVQDLLMSGSLGGSRGASGPVG